MWIPRTGDTTESQCSILLDRDFQTRYQQAEQAYGNERYSDAHAIAMGLLSELEETTPEASGNAAAWYGWRSFVALLLGHISLHGLEQPEQASRFYALVLESQPPDIQAQLAQQGLERSRTASRPEASNDDAPVETVEDAQPAATPAGALPDLLKDPFLLGDAPSSSAPAAPSRNSAMPWLDDNTELAEASAAIPVQPEPGLEPALEPEVLPEPEPEPLPEPEPEPEPEPLPEPEPDIELEASDEGELKALLKQHWIRVSIDDLKVEDDRDPFQDKDNGNGASSAKRERLASHIEPGQLNLQRAISAGWLAFRTSPWPFVGFTLIAVVVNLVSAITVVGPLLANLWMVTGLVRGSWMAVQGDRPTLGDLMRVDLNSWGRLFFGTLVVNVILFVIIAAAGIGAGLLTVVLPLLTIVIFLVAGILATAFSVTQTFLPFFTTVMELGPITAVQDGQARIQPLWWRALGLLLVEVVILLIGMLLIGVGLFAATPLMFCISAAAFLQIVGPMANDEPDLLP